ncbi:MAG: hypothetical protein NXH85_11550 [Pseudomonadaceae bacterium]|nr:hypothetical protein [Pseudomonadaceae bacterium]
MRFFERTVLSLFPTMALEGTPWLSVWKEKEKRHFLKVAQIVFPVAAVAYIAHYFFFDRAVPLEPLSFWLTFRLSMAAIAAGCFLFYCIPRLHDNALYKLPAVLACGIFCYFQARVLVWYVSDVYFYAFAFVIAATLIIRTTMLMSVLFGGVTITLMWPSFIEAGLQPSLLVSAAIFSLVAIVFIRSNYSAEVRYFLAEQSNLSSQREIIELNIEFAERLRSFLPKEISRRLENYVSQRQMTILQAAEEVLKPRTRTISCLFSDIRGFTESTRTNRDFVEEGVIPNVKECTREIEDNRGIPRKIGDLVFAYFDSMEITENVINSTLAGIGVINQNALTNQTLSANKIRRYVLVASGEAVVGNLGGFDSSVEITALGNPVNFLARLDDLTKSPKLSNIFREDHLVLDNTTAMILENIYPQLMITKVDLKQLDSQIRDFEEVEVIYTLEASASNRDIILRGVEKTAANETFIDVAASA